MTRWIVLGFLLAVSQVSTASPLDTANSSLVSPETSTTVSPPVITPEVSVEEVNKAYMNCLLEADRALESFSGNFRARDHESKLQLKLCENRKRDCSLKRGSADCRAFVEEFALGD